MSRLPLEAEPGKSGGWQSKIENEIGDCSLQPMLEDAHRFENYLSSLDERGQKLERIDIPTGDLDFRLYDEDIDRVNKCSGSPVMFDRYSDSELLQGYWTERIHVDPNGFSNLNKMRQEDFATRLEIAFYIQIALLYQAGITDPRVLRAFTHQKTVNKWCSASVAEIRFADDGFPKIFRKTNGTDNSIPYIPYKYSSGFLDNLIMPETKDASLSPEFLRFSVASGVEVSIADLPDRAEFFEAHGSKMMQFLADVLQCKVTDHEGNSFDPRQPEDDQKSVRPPTVSNPAPPPDMMLRTGEQPTPEKLQLVIESGKHLAEQFRSKLSRAEAEYTEVYDQIEALSSRAKAAEKLIKELIPIDETVAQIYDALETMRIMDEDISKLHLPDGIERTADDIAVLSRIHETMTQAIAQRDLRLEQLQEKLRQSSDPDLQAAGNAEPFVFPVVSIDEAKDKLPNLQKDLAEAQEGIAKLQEQKTELKSQQAQISSLITNLETQTKPVVETSDVQELRKNPNAQLLIRLIAIAAEGETDKDLPDEIQDVFSKLILAHQTAFWEIVQSHTGIPSGKLEPIRKGFAALITLTSLSQKTPTQETVMSSLVPIIKRSLSIEERASLNKMKDTNISQPSPKKLNQAGLQAYRELTRILREQSVSSST